MRDPLHWLTARPFAHRGFYNAQSGPPENSLAAVLAAMAEGYGSEIDVRLSRDGVVMVFHDPTLERMCGRTGRVEDYDAAELQTFALQGGEHRIPTLEEVLAQVRGQVPLLIEIKSGWLQRPGRLERAVAEQLRHYSGPAAVLAFNPYSLDWFRRHAPRIVRVQNAMTIDPLGRLGRFRKLALRMLHAISWGRPHGISYRVEDLPAPLTTRARASGRPVLAWTVRDKETGAIARAHADNMIWQRY
jgi:glycerophosphoryl diester phosphodiesterase